MAAMAATGVGVGLDYDHSAAMEQRCSELEQGNRELISCFKKLQEDFELVKANRDNLEQQLEVAYSETERVKRQSEERLREFEEEIKRGYERFDEDIKANLLPPEELLELRLKYVEELELPLKQKIDSLLLELESERENSLLLNRSVEALQRAGEGLRDEHARELRREREQSVVREDELRMEISTLKDTLNDMEQSNKSIPQLRRKIGEAERRLVVVGAENSELREGLQAALVARETDAQRHREQVLDLQHQIDRMRSEYDTVEKRRRHLDRELEEAMRSVERGRDRVQELSKEVEELSRRLQEQDQQHTADAERRREVASGLRHELEEYKITAQGVLEETKRQWLSEREQLQTALRRCEEELSSSREGLRRQLLEQQNSSQKIIEELRGELTDTRVNLEERTMEAESLKSNQSDSLRATTAQLRAEESRAAEFEIGMQRLQAQLEDMLVEKTRANEQLLEAEEAMRQAGERADTAVQEARASSAHAEELAQRLEDQQQAAEQRCEALEARAAEAENAVLEIRQEVDAREGALLGQQRQMGLEYDELKRKYRKTLKGAKKLKEYCAAAIEERQSKNRELRESLKSMEERVRSGEESASSQVARLQMQLRESERKLRSAEAGMQEAGLQGLDPGSEVAAGAGYGEKTAGSNQQPGSGATPISTVSAGSGKLKPLPPRS